LFGTAGGVELRQTRCQKLILHEERPE